MWDYRARVLSVHDGDTLTALLDLGFQTTITVQVRLLGVYAPELTQTGGPQTRDYVKQWVDTNTDTVTDPWPFIVRTLRLKSDAHEVTTLGRYVATVYAAGRQLNADVQTYVAAQGYGGGTGSGVPSPTTGGTP